MYILLLFVLISSTSYLHTSDSESGGSNHKVVTTGPLTLSSSGRQPSTPLHFSRASSSTLPHFLGTPPRDDELVLNVDALERDLAQTSVTSHPLITGNLENRTNAAKLVVGMLRGTAKRSKIDRHHLLPYIESVIKNMEEDPHEHANFLRELQQTRETAIARSVTRSRALRNISDEPAPAQTLEEGHDPKVLGDALKENVPSKVLSVINAASEAQYNDQTAELERLARTDEQKDALFRTKLWLYAGGGILTGVVAVASIALNFIQVLGVHA